MPTPSAATVPGDQQVSLLAMMSRNATRSEMALAMGCSTTTIDRRLEALRSAHGADTNIQLVVRAVREGWI
jgi:DNA-binding NarL/FixJ family response regulator